MKNMTRLFIVGALAASGVLAFACGGGNSEGGGGTTPSATAPATSATPSASTAMTATATATATTAPTPPAPPLTVVAMKLTDAKTKKTIEVKDDGSVLGPDGKLVAKFVGADLQDKDGKSLMSVAADGTLKAEGQTKPAKFNEKDEVLIGGGTIFVADDGTVKLIGPDGKADKDSGKIKLTGFKPQARRAATVFVLAMFMARAESSSGPGVVSSSAPATVTPAKK